MVWGQAGLDLPLVWPCGLEPVTPWVSSVKRGTDIAVFGRIVSPPNSGAPGTSKSDFRWRCLCRRNPVKMESHGVQADPHAGPGLFVRKFCGDTGTDAHTGKTPW